MIRGKLTFGKAIDERCAKGDGTKRYDDNGDPDICSVLAQGQIGREFDD